MHKTAKHINITKHILLLCLVLFALTPCIVKEVWFGAINIEYAKPLNKSKSTSSVSSCQYSHNDNNPKSAEKQSRIIKQVQPVCSSHYQFIAGPRDTPQGKHSKKSSGNSPPKYILYKRLKLDVA